MQNKYDNLAWQGDMKFYVFKVILMTNFFSVFKQVIAWNLK